MYVGDKTENVEQLIAEHVPLVKRIAYHLIHRLPETVRVDDLIQAGVIGLIEAARNYRPGQGATFETFAGIRIRGAMLDEVRRNDWIPRSIYRKARELSEAIRVLENRLGRAARDAEIATELKLSLDEYHRLVADATAYRVFSLDETQDNEAVDMEKASAATLAGPFSTLVDTDFRAVLVNTIAGLPEREKLVLSLYYDEELNLREIGEVLEVSESRISQILGAALIRLRAHMQEWRDR